MNDDEPAWLAAAKRAANAPPEQPRVPLFLSASGDAEAVEVGSIEASLVERIERAGLPLRVWETGWGVVGASDASLARIAEWLHAEGVCRHWRNELLDVVDVRGARVAAVERGVVRTLGITTFAVHLVGLTPGGDVWVQQRAFDKSSDPGAWDTLVGGLVAAGESLHETLQRETMEEAGLAVEQLQALRATGRIAVRRPVPEGYMIEHIDVFTGEVSAGVVPSNRDGEVERFECLDAASLRQRLAAGDFTLEATLILGAVRLHGAGISHENLSLAPSSFLGMTS